MSKAPKVTQPQPLTSAVFKRMRIVEGPEEWTINFGRGADFEGNPALDHITIRSGEGYPNKTIHPPSLSLGLKDNVTAVQKAALLAVVFDEMQKCGDGIGDFSITHQGRRQKELRSQGKYPTEYSSVLTIEPPLPKGTTEEMLKKMPKAASTLNNVVKKITARLHAEGMLTKVDIKDVEKESSRMLAKQLVQR